MLSPELCEVRKLALASTTWEIASNSEAISYIMSSLPQLGFTLIDYLSALDEDNSICLKNGNGDVLVLEDTYSGDTHIPCSLGRYEYWFPNEHHSWLSKFSVKELNDIGLTYDEHTSLPLATVRGKEYSNLDDYLKCNVRNNFKPHLYGEKSKRISTCVSLFEGDYSLPYHILKRNMEMYGGSSRDIARWVCNLKTKHPSLVAYKMELFVDGVLAGVSIFMEGSMVQYHTSCLVSDSEEFKPFSVYALLHLRLIERAINNNLVHTSGDFFPFKSIAGYTPSTHMAIVYPKANVKLKMFPSSFPAFCDRQRIKLSKLRKDWMIWKRGKRGELQLVVEGNSMYFSHWDGTSLETHPIDIANYR